MSGFVTGSAKRARVRVGRQLERRLSPAMNRHIADAYGGARELVGRGPGCGRILPDFMVIGAAKAGTTSLYRWLDDHPFVEFSSVKEPHYFSNHFVRGIHWYRSHFPFAAERDAFAQEHGRPFLTGEASPSYLAHYWSARRIAREVPEAKLIVTLRNPVDRAYSHYNMSRRAGDEPLETFEQALAAEDERMRGEHERMRADGYYRSLAYGNWSYITRGYYAEQIERWFEIFPRTRFHFLTLEELSATPVETLDAIHEFLGLPVHRSANLEPRHVGAYDPLQPATRAALQERMRSHNERLYELLGRDLGWDRPRTADGPNEA